MSLRKTAFMIADLTDELHNLLETPIYKALFNRSPFQVITGRRSTGSSTVAKFPCLGSRIGIQDRGVVNTETQQGPYQCTTQARPPTPTTCAASGGTRQWQSVPPDPLHQLPRSGGWHYRITGMHFSASATGWPCISLLGTASCS